MRFDELGCPQDNTSTDKQDSARLAGLVVMTGYADIPLHLYFTVANEMSEIIRHPTEKIYNISRDQVVCLVAGFNSQLIKHRFPRTCPLLFSRYKWRISKDIVSPSVRNHLSTCLLGESSRLGRLWLKLDLLYNSWFCDHNTEQNQLIAMCDAQDMLGDYVKSFPVWRVSLRKYWGDRQEHEFCEHLIRYVESKI